MPQRVYADWNATAPLRAEALDAMRPFLYGEAAASFGNAASVHRFGQAARAALERARRDCADVLGCAPGEIVFTSGGTESDNLALRGLAWAARYAWDERRLPGVPRLAGARFEHSAVRETLAALQRQGFEVEGDGHGSVGAQADGRVDARALLAACDERTAAVTLMLANNETGVVQPVAELARLLDERFGPRPGRAWPRFHVDAVQAVGKCSLKVDELGCDTLALSAHKFEGPKGAGLLYVRRGVTLEPLHAGGGHEDGRRGGTPNVAAAVGLATALKLAEAERPAHVARLSALRARFEAAVLAQVPGAVVHGASAERVANTSFVSFPGLDGPMLVLALDAEGLACSTGAACSEGVGRPSHVLDAMGLPPDLGRSAVRFSTGRLTREADVLAAAEIVARVVGRLRAK
ncbi:MAG: cysteine desulfurase [Planctomycetota bacterium]|nr:cysteine desulfurase [Planctomycetota bacterium]